MQHSAVARRFARPVLAFGIVTLAAVAACRDVTRPTGKTEDSWAEQTVVSLQVRSEVSVLDANGSAQRFSVSQRADYPVLFAGSSGHAPSFSRDGKAKRAVIKHFRDKEGKTHSLAFYSPTPGEPPKFIYAFENGRIRAIDSREYRRHGKGFVRSKSRVTVFDDTGRPTLQVDLTPDAVAQAARPGRSAVWTALLVAAKDIASVALPRELHAEEGSCTNEWLAYGAAVAAVTAASATLTATSAGCAAIVGPCVALYAAITAEAVAIANWSLKLDQLTACRLNGTRPTNDDGMTPGGYGSGGDGGGASMPEPDDADLYSSTEDTVSEFVGAAIDSGNYWCSSNGDYCVYYAAQ